MSDIQRVKKLYQLFLESKGVSTDTRSVRPGQIYFALKGDNFDGNEFAEQALEKGAAFAVVSDRSLRGPKFIHVEDTLDTLQALALEHRMSLSIPVIGITGSNGKTTTKELIAVVLDRKYRISYTQGNLNNHIGVPLSLLSIPLDCEIAIIEMGANHIGEIAGLCKLARPTCGLITNIGLAHIEGFGSLEGIKQGKSELYKWFAEHGGLAFVNLDELYLKELSSNVASRLYYGSGRHMSVAIRFNVLSDRNEIEIKGDSPLTKDIDIRSELFGRYNARNIMTAVAIGLHFDVEPEHINYAIAAYAPDNNRSQLIKRNGKLIILDAYNANPTSMQLAIESLVSRGGVKATILGGMNELGKTALDEHQKLIDTVKAKAIDTAIYVGKHYDQCSLPSSAMSFTDVDELNAYLARQELLADTILIKGSRSLRLESAVSHIH